jgi:hypothetical protein
MEPDERVGDQPPARIAGRLSVSTISRSINRRSGRLCRAMRSHGQTKLQNSTMSQAMDRL